MTADERLHRGDVWLVDLGTNPESPEQAFLRPAAIVSDDRLHHPSLRMAIVVPGTSTIRRTSLHVVVSPDRHNGLATDTAFQVEQVRAVSVVRLVERLGRLDGLARNLIDATMRNVLSL